MSLQRQRILNYLQSKEMEPSQIDMETCSDDYIDEMEQGLAEKNGGSMPMLPTFLEAGRSIPPDTPVIAVDAGGTNFRVALVSFHENEKPVIRNMRNYPMPGLKVEVDEETFFKQICGYLEPVLQESDTIGFCFSYPMDMQKNHDGRLIRFTKEIKAKAVEGSLIGESLNMILPEKKKIVLLNDTVSTLLAGRSVLRERVYDSYIGFILGTGMNCAYVEKNENIGKETGLVPGGEQVINIESGMYARAPRGKLDLVYDKSTDYPGKSVYEKMISGAYFGQMALTILQTAAEEGIFSADFRRNIDKIRVLDSGEISEFFSFPEGTGRLAECIQGQGAEDREALYHLLMLLTERAGKFTAITLSSIIRKTGKGQNPVYPVCITAEGSIFYKMPFMRNTIEFYLKQYLHDQLERSYTFVSVENASLIGGAVAGLTN